MWYIFYILKFNWTNIKNAYQKSKPKVNEARRNHIQQRPIGRDVKSTYSEGKSD